MLRFWKNIALFSLPFLALLAWMSMDTNYSKKYAYRQIQKDCRTGDWIYRRLYESEVPLEVAFIGTSKTMCDVNDSLLERRLHLEKGIDTHVSNLGVARPGENIHYLLARELLERKQPEILIVEVSTLIATNSHFHFPMLANAGDVWLPTFIYNDDLFHDILAFSWNRLLYTREHILGIERQYDDFLTNPEHSFMRVPVDVIADSSEMERIRQKRANKSWDKAPTGVPGLVSDLSTNYPKQYIRRIHELCREKNVRLYFLYLPMYGLPVSEPREKDFYLKMAPILYPPDSIFRNPRLHFDGEHLNQAGAARLSDWLMETLAGIIQENQR